MTRLFLTFALLTSPLLASAHTRWFTEGELEPYVSTEPTGLYLSISAIVILILTGLAILFHKKKWLHFPFLKPTQTHVFERAASTFTMMVGAFFLIAGTHEYLFSPNLTEEAGIPMFLLAIEIFIGLAFLLGIGTRFCAIVLSLSWVSLFYYSGWVSALEDIWVLSTAVFIMLMGNDYFSIYSSSKLRDWFAPYKLYALSIIRLGTGITLMTLGFSEKILAPEFGINFLSQYDWNFMQLTGLEYSNYLFTLTAGSVEFLLGLTFVLGLITRLNALVTTIIFTIPLFILGPIELAGHLPHFAAVTLLLLFGSGGHFTFFSRLNRK